MYYCAFVGSFGDCACNPRTLSSAYLNNMVSLEGIVTKCSLVRPKVVKSVHYSEVESKFLFREYRDQTMSANGPASMSVYPTEDENGKPVSRTLLYVFNGHGLTVFSSSLSTDTARTEITRPSQSKRCQSERQQVNCRAA